MRGLVGAAVCLALLPHVSAAQGTKADYERAAALRERFQNKVFRHRVLPNWIGTGERFWYRNDLADGRKEFVLVDAALGRCARAFDHAKLAEALAAVVGRSVDAERLPFTTIAFEEDLSAVVFRVDGRYYRCSLRDYRLSPAEAVANELAGLPSEERPRPTVRTGEETTLRFDNRSSQDVTLYWMDAEGRRVAYAALGPGESREQHTFGGHVWLAVSRAGVLLGVWEATDRPALVVIRDPAPGQARRARPRGGAPSGSPDGRWSVVIREHNVWLREEAAGTERQLTTDGTAEDSYGGELRWSPDSRHFVVMKTRAGDNRVVTLVESSPPDQVQPRVRQVPYLKPGDRVPIPRPHLFRAEDGRHIVPSTALCENPYQLGNVRWQPDSRSFTFHYNQRGHQVWRLLSVDVETGETRALIEERSETFIDYAGKFALEHLDATGELLWMSERSGWNHLYLIDAATGSVKNAITQGEWVVRGLEYLDVERREVWFRASGIHPREDPYHVHYGRVNLDGTGLTWLTEGDGTHTVSFSPDRKYLVDTYSRVDMPPVTELRDARTGRLLCVLERADITALRQAGWRAAERFSAPGRDGKTPIHGIIHTPTGFDSRKRYPVVEAIYAGPHAAHVPKAFSSYYGVQEIVELGFVVVQIDGMGTSFRSKAFHDVAWRNLADAGLPDRIAWMRAAAKTRPWMDLTRVGIYGGSAGGQNALGALLQHGDFYKVAVADCGCHDNRMDKIWWNELWMGWPIGPHYAEQSNVTLAPRLTGKLLLIVGELDTNVDPASTLQVANALIKADKDFDMLLIPGAGHGAAETPYGRRRRQDFLVRHLMGVEPRAR